MKNETRDNFPPGVIHTIKHQSAFICSNPDCRRMTLAPSGESENHFQYSGKVAHITAAAKGGPRFDANISVEERESISNAIFLCGFCADLIDKNKGLDYSVTILHEWKRLHKEWTLKNLNKSSESQQTFNHFHSNNQTGGISANVVNINSQVQSEADPVKQHDTTIFNKAINILNGEQLNITYQELSNSGSMKADDNNRLFAIAEFFENPDHVFINEDIETAKVKFILSIIPFMEFNYHFDKWPYHQDTNNYTIQLMPTLLRNNGYTKEDTTDHKKWKQMHNDLMKVTNNLVQAYKGYRFAVKKNLHI